MSIQLMKKKAKQFYQLIRHFESPWLLLLLRLGWAKVACCSHKIRKGSAEYTMLGRILRGDVWILREVLVEESYASILKFLPSKPVRVVDIGAHIGAFTVWLNRQHAVSEVFCFEPDPDSFSLCQFNLARNGCACVQLRLMALGGTTREADIWTDEATQARSSLYRRTGFTGQSTKVHVLALQEWLETIPGHFDLIKMDCEGAEWEMIDIAPSAFTRFSIIIAEIHRDPEGGRDIHDFAKLLNKQGFETVSTSGLYIGRRVPEPYN